MSDFFSDLKPYIWGMETLTVHPQDKKQLNAVEAVLKALNVPFEKAKEESPYDPAFVAKIKKSQQDYKEGKGTVMTLKALKELCK